VIKQIWITDFGMWGTGKFWGEPEDRAVIVDTSKWTESDWDEFEDSQANEAIVTAQSITERRNG